MITSVDGGLHPSRWTACADGTRADWSDLYERIHQSLAGDAWMVGRVTMAELAGTASHAQVEARQVDRPFHFAARGAAGHAVVLDPSGKLRFGAADIGGDHVVVLLGRNVPDSHLAALAADGVSYVVADEAQPDLATVLKVLAREFGVRRLLLEGGATINGGFFEAGLVDELSLLVAPALDARRDSQGIVEAGEMGLAGKVQLSLTACESVGHGAVHLRYAVTSG
jgi:riboflavin biosynthesis pyrimidine reductase